MTGPFDIVTCHTPGEISRYPAPLLGDFDPVVIERHQPDCHLMVQLPDGALTARVSLWWKNSPPLEDHKIGCIGHFAAAESVSAQEVLNAACRQLTNQGCTLAVGPIDGSTWRRYRFLTSRGEEPQFLMEPDNPDDWPTYWTKTGFEVLASYFSALNKNLTFEDPKVMRAGKRLAEQGIQLRNLDLENYHRDLQAIYDLSLDAFVGNLLYTPLPETEFFAEYETIQSRIRPELVLLAEMDNQLVGYLFAIPDWLRGPETDTVIIKTVAILPHRKVSGLGAWLVANAQIAARELGYTRVIHALMHENNVSRRLSARYAKPFRSYTLFKKQL